MANSNPFKFGTVVDGSYFTNRVKEIDNIKAVIKSPNHLILISPRRFGKTSLVKKVLSNETRQTIFIDVQLANSIEDFAALYLKRIYSIFQLEKIRNFVRNFRVIPNIALNPVNNNVEVSFQPNIEHKPLLEDVLNLAEKLSSPDKRLIVVLDEFQDINRIGKETDRLLRSVLQNHKNINYIFMGSQESMMLEIFEKKKSPFYHFGQLMYLSKIEKGHFKAFIASRLEGNCKKPETVADSIIEFTKGHPYYSQQLAYLAWNLATQGQDENTLVDSAITETIQVHDLDYERLWITFNTTDKKILTNLATKKIQPLSANATYAMNIKASSTIFSSLKRLMKSGYIFKANNTYEIDDPFFRQWIIKRRQ